MTDDPFAPIVDRKKPRLRVVANASDLTNVAPIPADAPTPPQHPLGAPTATWIYRDAEGRDLGRTHRFDRDGQKEFRPLTLWRKGAAAPTWRWQSWPEPRPLYGLDRLAKRPEAPVVVAEGEKSADAAQRLLPGHVAVTSPGGSKAAAKADWSQLAGRHVAIWPDADDPGDKYAQAVAAALKSVGAASVVIVSLSAAVVKGWDAADAEAEGWTPARVADLVRAASARGETTRKQDAAGGKPRDKAAKAVRGVEAIIGLVQSEGVEFWRDAEQNAYATVRVRGHRENYPIEGRAFLEWIVRVVFDAGLTPPNTNTLKEAVVLFGAWARFDGVEKAPIRRSGRRAGKIYVDLGDARWRVVEVDLGGWRILDDHDLPIVRSKLMLPLGEPEAGGSIGDLYRFLNMSGPAMKLVVGWALMALAGKGPYPILMLNGEEGSAKTTQTKLVKGLIDPSVAPVRALPREERVLAVTSRHSHVLAFDNASGIDADMSDALCRISTGAGLSSRAMYSNEDEHTIFAKNPVILNGIPNLASRPDLASRALLVKLPPISETARMTEEEFEAEWSRVAPFVLGVLLDALSCALRKLPETKLERSGRMADFEQFVEASASAFEWEAGEFSEALRGLRAETDAILVGENEVAAAIVAFIVEQPSRRWRGAPSLLLDLLSQRVTEAMRRSRYWPMNATALGKRFDRVASVLRRQGIDVEHGHSGSRFWTIDATRYADLAAANEASGDT